MEGHRIARREAGFIVYPVISRRSGGLSVGINLFPDRKVCSFDCPYCEVFPFESDHSFTVGAMERELRLELADAAEDGFEVKDLCFSGNGEPTLSPDFFPALEAATRVRDVSVPGASLVLITNGTTLLDPGIERGLRLAASGGGQRLDIWLKLDAGTEAWYRRIDRASVPFAALMDAFGRFAATAPFTLQTMVCAVGGEAPPAAEAEAWEATVLRLCAGGGGRPNVRRVQIYGKARSAPEDPLAEPLAPAFLEARAASLREALRRAGYDVPVSVFP